VVNASYSKRNGFKLPRHPALGASIGFPVAAVAAARSRKCVSGEVAHAKLASHRFRRLDTIGLLLAKDTLALARKLSHGACDRIVEAEIEGLEFCGGDSGLLLHRKQRDHLAEVTVVMDDLCNR
jgi:hypothetical protein